MAFLPCSYLGVEVELSEERERHIRNHHPDLLPKHRGRIIETVGDPDHIRRSLRVGNAKLFAVVCKPSWRKICGGCCDLRFSAAIQPLDHHSLHSKEVGGRRNRMAEKLTFQYDREADVLHIGKCAPYADQESEELGDEVVARLNPKTGEVENLEVLFFSTRLFREDLFELPVSTEMHLITVK